jgi:hypothetical protein
LTTRPFRALVLALAALAIIAAGLLAGDAHVTSTARPAVVTAATTTAPTWFDVYQQKILGTAPVAVCPR